MDLQAEHPAEEIKDLRRCLNDLVSVLALPAMWSGGEPSHVVHTLLDSLLGMLHLDFVYARVNVAAGEAPIIVVKVSPLQEHTLRPREICDALSEGFGDHPEKWPPRLRASSGDGSISIVPLRLGIHGEIGTIAAGSGRADFPARTESLLLSVAANQAAIGLQEARHRLEQERVADDLDRQVAQRTAELAAVNEELKREVAERRRADAALRESETNARLIIDGIPGLVCTMTAAGEIDLFNRQVPEFFGKTPAELKGWATSDAVHPDDLPRVIEAFTHSVTTGTPYDIEHRCRRADGVYRWFQVRALPLRAADGRVTGWYVLLTDVDDRKRAEEELRASERYFNQIINTIPALAWSARADGSAEFFNQHYLDYVGLSAEQVKDWGWTVAVHPDDLDGLIAAWQRMMAADQAGECEGRLRRFDGEYRWFLFRTNPLRDESGTTVKWFGTNTDIDDRKRMEEELRRSEARKTAILDSALDCILTIDHEGRITEFNPAAVRTFGYRRDDVEGKPLADVIIPAALRDQHKQGFARYQATGEARVLGRRIEMRAVRSDGSEFPVELAISRIPLEGPPSFTGYLRDITERKQAEEELRRSEAFLAEGQKLARLGSFSWRVESDRMTWSDQLYRIFGFEPGELVTLERIGSRIHPEDVHLLSDMIEQARRAVSDLEYEYRLLMPDLTVKHLLLVAHGAQDQEGRMEYIGAVQDVTERRLSEAALSQARSDLAHVTRVTSLGVLTASIAHEVNQPLSGIVTNAGTCLRMLATEPPNVDGARETARRTIRDGNRAAELITRLRALFTRKESASEPVDLNDATREVIALSLSEFQRNRVILRPEFAEDLPVVTGDRVQLQQVILNLLKNASDAMSTVDDRPRQLRIRTERDAGDYVRVTVEDAGVGLDPRDTDRLFEPFYTTKDDGMGIGLSVSRSIIERHRGRLWAAPNDGPGATFAFSIPPGPRGVTDER
jgi:PAS domain S-box-containing protein